MGHLKISEFVSTLDKGAPTIRRSYVSESACSGERGRNYRNGRRRARTKRRATGNLHCLGYKGEEAGFALNFGARKKGGAGGRKMKF